MSERVAYIPLTDRAETTKKLEEYLDPLIEKTTQILFEAHANVAETNRAEHYVHVDGGNFMRYGELDISVNYTPKNDDNDFPSAEHNSIDINTGDEDLYIFDHPDDGSYDAYELIPLTPGDYPPIPEDVRNMIFTNLYHAFVNAPSLASQVGSPLTDAIPTASSAASIVRKGVDPLMSMLGIPS